MYCISSFHGVHGIFTALLAPLVGLASIRCLLSQMAMGCNRAIEPNVLWSTDFYLFFFYPPPNLFFVSLLHCSLHTLHLIRQAFTQSLFYPPLQKQDWSRWTTQEFVGLKENKGEKKEGLAFALRKTPKTERKILKLDEKRNALFHPSHSYSFIFLFFFCLCPSRIGGFL